MYACRKLDAHPVSLKASHHLVATQAKPASFARRGDDHRSSSDAASSSPFSPQLYELLQASSLCIRVKPVRVERQACHFPIAYPDAIALDLLELVG